MKLKALHPSLIAVARHGVIAATACGRHRPSPRGALRI
jgi:hypothetical protein